MAKRQMKEYRIWKAMKARCYAPSQNKGYYKQNHIQVCDRWRNDFETFLSDMGSIPGEDYSIERIDVMGDYCPENCTWIPMRDQPKNRSNSKMFTHDGITMCAKDWARRYGIKYGTFMGRLYKGISFEQAIKL